MTTNGEKRRAFVLDEATRLNFSGAAKFGEIEYIFRKGEWQPSVWGQAYVDEACSRLESRGYRPDYDFIVVSGHIAALVLVIAHIARTRSQSINLLMFDSTQCEYTHKVLL